LIKEIAMRLEVALMASANFPCLLMVA